MIIDTPQFRRQYDNKILDRVELRGLPMTNQLLRARDKTYVRVGVRAGQRARCAVCFYLQCHVEE